MSYLPASRRDWTPRLLSWRPHLRRKRRQALPTLGRLAPKNDKRRNVLCRFVCGCIDSALDHSMRPEPPPESRARHASDSIGVLVDDRTHNAEVVGSSPTLATIRSMSCESCLRSHDRKCGTFAGPQITHPLRGCNQRSDFGSGVVCGHMIRLVAEQELADQDDNHGPSCERLRGGLTD